MLTGAADFGSCAPWAPAFPDLVPSSPAPSDPLCSGAHKDTLGEPEEAASRGGDCTLGLPISRSRDSALRRTAAAGSPAAPCARIPGPWFALPTQHLEAGPSRLSSQNHQTLPQAATRGCASGPWTPGRVRGGPEPGSAAAPGAEGPGGPGAAHTSVRLWLTPPRAGTQYQDQRWSVVGGGVGQELVSWDPQLRGLTLKHRRTLDTLILSKAGWDTEG